MKILLTKPMDELKADGLRRLDVSLRAKRDLLTGSNYDVYLAKFHEVQRFLAGGTDLPLLKVDAVQRGLTLKQVTDEVSKKWYSLSSALAELEDRRQKAQAEIRSASCPADIEKVLGGV